MRYLKLAVPLALCVVINLCACAGLSSLLPAGASETSEASRPPRVTEASYDIPGEEASGEAFAAPSDLPAEAPSGPADGIEGNYYNDYLRVNLYLDGRGGCKMSGPSGEETGLYYIAEDGAISLSFSERWESAAIDADGDLRIEGRTGYFLHDWDKWGITAAEAGIKPSDGAASAVETVPESDRYRDFEKGVALRCAPEMEILDDLIVGGLAVRDGRGGWVTARNVTEIYSTHSGSDDEFLLDYTRNFVFADFDLFYGPLGSYAGLTAKHEGIEGRLACVTLTLTGAEGGDVEAKSMLYTSTYADGTVNYICKTVYAAPGGVEALERAVTDVGAVRWIAAG